MALIWIFLLGTAVAGTSDMLAGNEVRSMGLAVVVGDRNLLQESLVEGAPSQNLPEGVVVQVLDEVTGKMVSVRLVDGREGYMSRSLLAIVD